MAVKCIPAVLARTSREYRQRLLVAESLASTIHLDIMDGVFVPTKTLSWAKMQSHMPRRTVDIHAMVRQLDELVPMIVKVHPRRVYIHVEVPSTTLKPFIAFLRSRRIQVGLSINPTTRLDRLAPYVRSISAVMVMGVRPGRYGAPWQSTTLARLPAIRQRWPRLIRVYDGGVSEQTIQRIVRAGAQELVIGSAVMNSDDPSMVWRRLRTMTKR